MNFPLGPFRNAGDFRLWIVASLLWMALTTVCGFYLDPPWPSPSAPSSSAMSFLSPISSHNSDPAYDNCFGNDAEQDACANAHRVTAQESVREAIRSRLGIIVVPPFAVLGAIWLAISAVEWVRRGYAG